MVEQRSPKPTVEGSSPSAPARHNEAPFGVFLFLSHLNFLWPVLAHPLFLRSLSPFPDSLTPQHCFSDAVMQISWCYLVLCPVPCLCPA